MAATSGWWVGGDVSGRRPPPKRRGQTQWPRTVNAKNDHDETRGNNAPGHLGGQFEDAGYGESHWDGYFGFQPKHQIEIE